MADRIADETYAERARLTSLLEGLEPEQWDVPSLCAGWRVREVVAHITMPFRTSAPRFVVGLVRARFSFDRYAGRDARAYAARTSDGELVELLRGNIRHPWQPPGGGQAGALSHDVIHGLDITEPLGLPGPPSSRIELVLHHAGKRNFDYFGVDLDGTRLEATDADIVVGDGAPRRMSAKDLLLVVTGRTALAEVLGENG